MFKRILAFTLMLCFIFTCVVFAETAEEARQKLNQLNQEKGNLQQKLDVNKEQKSNVVKDKKTTEAEIAKKEQLIADMQNQLNESEARVKSLLEEHQKAVQTMESQREALKKRLRTMAEQGQSNYLEVIFSATSFSDVLSRYELVQDVLGYDKKLLQTQKDNVDRVMVLKSAAEIEKKEK
ncbi:MAG: hypothetical protein H7Y41_07125, partial [Hyphomonadaceae bacterium]|nr:hypothetical protein [Clostridia bacterium]